MDLAAELALTELLDQVADLSDHLVFLQRMVPQALALREEAQATALVRQAAALISTPGAALHVDGKWLGDTPGWLRVLDRPAQAVVLPPGSVHTGAPFTFAWRLTSVLVVPLDGGWLALWGKRDFMAVDRALIATLAQLLDAALRALRQRREAEAHALEVRDRRQARAVWRAVTPEQLLPPAGYCLSLHSQPASDFGGDFQFQEGEWVVVGDVSGKGLPAAIITAMFASAFSVAAHAPEMLPTLSTALYHHLERSGSFCTLVALHLQPDGQVKVLNVGHPPVLLRRSDGTLKEIRASAPPMGTFPLAHVHEELVCLHPGDALLIYSDGLYEAEDHSGEAFGLERTRHLAAQTEPGAFITQAVEALGTYAVTDDLTLLVLQRDPAVPSLNLHLTDDLSRLPEISEALRALLDEHHPALMPAELALTELVVNAVRHGQARTLTLRAHRCENELLVTMTDDGQPYDPRLEPRQAAGELREHGYGLLIVQRCAAEWQYARTHHLNRQILRLRAPDLSTPQKPT